MENYRRKLAAIFSADVAGYSRLMGDDEAATVDTLTTYREVMYSLIKQHRGRVVDSPGDNVLAEFASVVDAAQCSVAIQKELQSRNLELPEKRRMQFRIGINLGDVIEEGERIYGDGVNIAARLEALADPGGICISKTAFDHIESKLPLGYEFIGEQIVKNISKPVFAYKVIMDPRVVSSTKTKRIIAKSPWIRNSIIVGGAAVLILLIFGIAGILPRCADSQKGQKTDERPSIAIIPLKNMSDDPSQEHFSDGITEELIHSLARIKGLRVASQTSSFYYKGRNVALSTIGKELSVDYVLEGSVRKSENKLRITAQLIGVADDTPLWSETYDREMKDVFNIQDEISEAVVKKLEIELLGPEEKRKAEYSIVEHERRIGINVKVDDDEIIGGGLLAGGLNVEIAGSVKGGLKAYGGHVVISGNSQDMVNFRGADVTLSGNFQDEVRGTAKELILSGTFEKDLEVNATHILITPEAVMKGDLIYSAVTLDRKKGSQIAGKIIQVDDGDTESLLFFPEESKWSTLLKGIYWDLTILVFAVFLYYLVPKQNERILTTISSNIFIKSLTKGLLLLIMASLIIPICFISFVGIPFGTVCLCMVITLIILGPVYGSLWIGRRLLSYFKVPLLDNFFVALVTGIIVIDALSMIPFVGWLVKAFIFLVSIGAIWQVIWVALKSGREDAADVTS
jgi:TolB-like protein/class 3 adenylate cyclase